MQTNQPIYSICMVNLNMESTIIPAIASIANQLNDDFEIVVIDGGSSDTSLQKLELLTKFYKNISYHALPRDKSRKLGQDRNISVQKARGKYCLLHLDCDDVYLPFIQQWIKVYHQIEKRFGHDILVSGEHINMGERETLLKHGPYRNIAYEDRDMWARFAALDKWIPLKHKDFVIRLPKTKKKQFRLSVSQVFTAIVEDLRQPDNTFLGYLRQDFNNLKIRPSLKLIVLRVALIPFAGIKAHRLGKFKIPDEFKGLTPAERAGLPAKISQLKKEKSNFTRILESAGVNPQDISCDGISREIFLI